MRTALRWLLLVGAMVVAAVPALIVYGTGLAAAVPDVLGPGSGPLFVLAIAYVVWLPATAFGLIWALDRSGVHHAADRSAERASERTRHDTRRARRRRAGLRYLQARERARRTAADGPRSSGKRGRGGE